jgi:hypothetical protein
MRTWESETGSNGSGSAWFMIHVQNDPCSATITLSNKIIRFLVRDVQIAWSAQQIPAVVNLGFLDRKLFSYRLINLFFYYLFLCAIAFYKWATQAEKYLSGIEDSRCIRLTTQPPSVNRLSIKYWTLNISQHNSPPQPITWTDLLVSFLILLRPPLWSSDQNSWLQFQRFRFRSPALQIFWAVADLERGPLSLVRINKILKVAAPV